MTIIEKKDQVTLKEKFKKVISHFKKKPGHFKKNWVTFKSNNGHFFDVQSNRE